MDKNNLRDSLDNFHKELEKTTSIESGDRKRLEHLEAEMRGMLEADEIKHVDSMIEQLEHAIHQFEMTIQTSPWQLDTCLISLARKVFRIISVPRP